MNNSLTDSFNPPLRIPPSHGGNEAIGEKANTITRQPTFYTPPNYALTAEMVDQIRQAKQCLEDALAALDGTSKPVEGLIVSKQDLDRWADENGEMRRDERIQQLESDGRQDSLTSGLITLDKIKRFDRVLLVEPMEGYITWALIRNGYALSCGRLPDLKAVKKAQGFNGVDHVVIGINYRTSEVSEAAQLYGWHKARSRDIDTAMLNAGLEGPTHERKSLIKGQSA